MSMASDIELGNRSDSRGSRSSSSADQGGSIFNLCRRKQEEETRRLLVFDDNGQYVPPETKEDGVPFMSNKIKTSKYTPITFIPYNFFEQVIRPANTYFCFIAVLQSIKEVSISDGLPTILVPLICVFAVSGLKDLLEDLKRHKDDKEENQRKMEVLQNDGSFLTKLSEDIKVGEIVRVRDRQRFPADLLLISSAKGHKAPYCYVETSNIDGETNLKLKQSPEGFNSLPSFDSVDRVSLLCTINDQRASDSFNEYKKRMSKSVEIKSDPPNGDLDTWGGAITNVQVPNMRDNNGDDGDEKEEDDKLFANDFADISYDERNVNLSFDNLLLRGSELRNSDWIYGLVIYTGFNCKIFMNNKSRSSQRIKRSSVEKTMNRFIFYMAGAQVIFCILCAILSGIWTADNGEAWYLYTEYSASLDAFFKFFTWFIIFAQFIPISLLVTMEVVKFTQAQFMQWDIQMYHRLQGKTDKFCKVQNSNLNEELGQIEYVFSDKTGTLTDNSLDFRKCVIADTNFGTGETEIGRAAKRRAEELNARIIAEEKGNEADAPMIPRSYTSDFGTQSERTNNAMHVNFDAESEQNLRDKLKIALEEDRNGVPMNERDQLAIMCRRFLTVLAMNNSCYPVMEDDKLEIRAASPDDECLTCFAQFMGVQLAERNPPSVRVDIFPDGLREVRSKYGENWEQLAELPFTSKRKRMSVILRNLQTGKIHFTMKGADSEMFKYIKREKSQQRYHDAVEKYLGEYSEQGLRTLVIAEAILPPEWWDNKWSKEFERFQENTLIMEETEKGHLKGACSDDCRKCKWYAKIEMEAGLQLLGCTGIEDKLQDSVPETISAMLDGGINVWVLTGDKQKTAENIGIACNLLEPAMERNNMLFKLVVSDGQKLHKTMNDAIETIDKEQRGDYGANQPAGLVINSRALKAIMDEEEQEPDRDLKSIFLKLAQRCKSVIGVRMQPNQKAQVIEFIQSRLGVRTLAIGDGTNDEPMIRTANVGVGITGLEGTAAVRASDYAVGRFKFLKRLMFVHGRLHYRRITTLVCYIFYKNGLLSLSSFYFGFYNGFSGQIFFNEWAYQAYNVVFTALPIMLFAVIDRDHTDEYLKSHPRLYRLSQSGDYFNAKVFFAWVVDSLVASCLLVLVPLNCYENMTSPDHTGQSAGIWTVGLVILTSIVFTANLRLAFISKSWMWLTHFFFFGSIAAYFFTIVVLNLSTIFYRAGADYYWLVFRVMGTGRFWLTVMLTTLIVLFLPFTYFSFTTLRRNNSMATDRKYGHSVSSKHSGGLLKENK